MTRRLPGKRAPRPLAADVSGSGVIELRRYTLHPDTREMLIELFEREFVETQEAVGLGVLGTFRDPDHPDTFVWLRGFTDMRSRGVGLPAFYGGPVWAEHKDAANATMIDSDDVLLLRPLDAPSRLDLDTSRRPPLDGSKVRAGAACVTICALAPGQADAFAGFCRREVEPRLRRAGANVRARFATEHSENNYPALPVRQGEEVFVWLSLFPKTRARDRHIESVGLHALLRGRWEGVAQTFRLDPTARSLLPD